MHALPGPILVIITSYHVFSGHLMLAPLQFSTGKKEMLCMLMLAASMESWDQGNNNTGKFV